MYSRCNAKNNRQLQIRYSMRGELRLELTSNVNAFFFFVKCVVYSSSSRLCAVCGNFLLSWHCLESPSPHLCLCLPPNTIYYVLRRLFLAVICGKFSLYTKHTWTNTVQIEIPCALSIPFYSFNLRSSICM